MPHQIYIISRTDAQARDLVPFLWSVGDEPPIITLFAGSQWFKRCVARLLSAPPDLIIVDTREDEAHLAAILRCCNGDEPGLAPTIIAIRNLHTLPFLAAELLG